MTTHFKLFCGSVNQKKHDQTDQVSVTARYANVHQTFYK